MDTPKTYTCHECTRSFHADKFITRDGGYIVRCHECQSMRGRTRFRLICPQLYQQTIVKDLPRPELFSKTMEWKAGSRGLLLRGKTSTGKTRCAWKLIERILTLDLLPVEVFDCIGFGHELARRYASDDPTEEAAEDWLDRLAKVPVVFFDDLGKLKLTERAEAELFALVERRTANMLPIIATTNDSGSMLESRMTDNRGEPLIRRLREFCDIISF